MTDMINPLHTFPHYFTNHRNSNDDLVVSTSTAEVGVLESTETVELSEHTRLVIINAVANKMTVATIVPRISVKEVPLLIL